MNGSLLDFPVKIPEASVRWGVAENAGEIR
jgi:hypothetical protein